MSKIISQELNNFGPSDSLGDIIELAAKRLLELNKSGRWQISSVSHAVTSITSLGTTSSLTFTAIFIFDKLAEVETKEK